MRSSPLLSTILAIITTAHQPLFSGGLTGTAKKKGANLSSHTTHSTASLDSLKQSPHHRDAITVVPTIPDVSGFFSGRIFCGDDMDSVQTYLTNTASEHTIIGDYVIYEEEGETAGTLEMVQAEDPHTFYGHWEDKYGRGPVRLLFTSQFDAFNGYWGNHLDSIFLPFQGAKEQWHGRLQPPINYLSIFSVKGVWVLLTEYLPSLWRPKKQMP